MIHLAGDREREEGSLALGIIIQRYRAPLLAHLLHRFATDAHQADEWFDAFVEKKILEKNLLTKANAAKGRFRGFLVKCLDHFVDERIKYEQRSVRHPEEGFIPLEFVPEHTWAATNTKARPDPGDRAWALTVLEQARERTEAYYHRKNRPQVWAVFYEGLYLPKRERTPRPSDAVLAARYEFESPAQVSNTIKTVERKFGRCVRQVLAEYLPGASPEEIDAELRELLAILSE